MDSRARARDVLAVLVVAASAASLVAGLAVRAPARGTLLQVGFLAAIAVVLGLFPVRIRDGQITFSAAGTVAAGLLFPGGGVALVALASGIPNAARPGVTWRQRLVSGTSPIAFHVAPSLLAAAAGGEVTARAGLLGWPVPQLAVYAVTSLAANQLINLAVLKIATGEGAVTLARRSLSLEVEATELGLYLIGAVVAVLLQFRSGYVMASLCLAVVLVLRGRLRDRRQLADLRLAVKEDPLTGLANRRALLEAAGGRERLLAVMMLDVDDFKQVNDVYGHEAGDHVLRGVAEILRGAIRTGDLACRFGGEEFCLVLPRARLEVAQRIAARVRAEVEAVPLLPDGSTVTVSIGLATGFAGLKELIQSADAALYEAKRGGKNRVVVG